jgi:hypothetical protein
MKILSKSETVSDVELQKLNRMNKIAAVLHGSQGLLMLLLATAFALPVTTGYLVFNTSTEALDPATITLFNVQLVWLIVAFLFMSCIAHLFISTKYRKKYESDMKLGINKARWFEYAFSASTMMVAIAMLVGIYDIGALLAIFALTAGMNMMGLVMEVHNQTTKKTNWLSYIIGCFLGAIPWIMIAIFFWASSVYGSSAPAFVYAIYVSIFVAFNCFAINMYLQYKKTGKWSRYIYGEKVYILLSLVAKSALAWQVFAGTLRP